MELIIEIYKEEGRKTSPCSLQRSIKYLMCSSSSRECFLWETKAEREIVCEARRIKSINSNRVEAQVSYEVLFFLGLRNG